VPSVLIAGVFSIVVAAPLAWPFTPTVRDLVVLGVMGVAQVGAGCVLMTIASRYLTAGEIGLLALLETILGPIWVWLGIGERPTPVALAGSAIVLGALLANAAAARRSRSAAGATVA
jgi:drug/metabolite transporter (DMT)-like permease